jgi:hypothetical protein
MSRRLSYLGHDTISQEYAMPVLDQLAGDAARIPMTEDAILGLLRQHFGADDSLYLAPLIPPRREVGARCAHGAGLPSDERILALYDDTVFGSGEDGFVVTARRLCWKNIKGEPRSIEWRFLDPESVIPYGRKLSVAESVIHISGGRDVIGAAADVFYMLAISARLFEGRLSAAPTTPPPMEGATYESYVTLSSSPDVTSDDEDQLSRRLA